MGLFDFNYKKPRTDGQTFDGQGTERTGFIDNVFVNLEKGVLLQRYPYDNLSTSAKVTVQEGQQFVFMSEGMYSDTFMPGSYTLTTNNLPFLQKIVNIPFGGDSAFKTTLFCVSTKRQRFTGDDAGWGVGLTVRDYTLSDEGITIKVGAYGGFEFRIVNAIAFIREYSGTEHEILLDDFADEFQSAVNQRVTPAISKFFSQRRISITDVNNYLAEVADFAKREVNEYLEDYGIELTKFDVESAFSHICLCQWPADGPLRHGWIAATCCPGLADCNHIGLEVRIAAVGSRIHLARVVGTVRAPIATDTACTTHRLIDSAL